MKATRPGDQLPPTRLVATTRTVAAAAATAAAQTATADSSTPSWAPKPGARIRGYVLRPDSAKIEGWVVRYYGPFAAIATCARCTNAVWIPIDSVLALEGGHATARYRGSDFVAYVAKATGVGAVVGLGVGVFMLATSRCHCDGFDRLEVPVGAVYGTGVGFVAGFVSGLVAEKQAWTPVRRP